MNDSGSKFYLEGHAWDLLTEGLRGRDLDTNTMCLT